MRFEQAVKAMEKGSLISRRKWSAGYLVLDGWVKLVKCGNTEKYNVTKQDVVADDWQITVRPNIGA